MTTDTSTINGLSTSRDVAKRFGVTVFTVRRWVRERKIPCLRASARVVRFRMDEVEEALHSAKDGPAPT